MIRQSWACAIAILFVAVSASSSAWADDCGPLVPMASLDMTPVAGGARMTVPVTVNGMPKTFLVATAAGATTMTLAAGANLALRAHYDDRIRFLDTAGYSSKRYFTLPHVGLGRLKADGMDIIATADPQFGKDPPLDGVIAADIMEFYDVEFDFANRKLNFFSQNHCPGHVIYWGAAAAGSAAITISRRAGDFARSGQGINSLERIVVLQAIAHTGGPQQIVPLQGVDIRTIVTLDGKDFTANIDTGAEVSALNTASARAAYDVTEDSPGSAPVETPAPDPKPGAPATETVTVRGTHVFEHTFHSLSFGGVTVTNPRFLVRPDTTGLHDPDNDYQTGTRVARVDDFPRPEITIGMDVLSKLHLYFAFKEGKLYITARGHAADGS